MYIEHTKHIILLYFQKVRVHGISRQKRVLGRSTGYCLKTSRYYSIPVDTPFTFCVVKGRKRGKKNNDYTLNSFLQIIYKHFNVQMCNILYNIT